MSDVIKLKGRYFVTLYGPDGDVKDYREGNNVVTTVGKEYMASFFYSSAVAAATMTSKYLAIGTGATAESAGDTALGTETARVAGTPTYVSGCIYNLVATFGTGVGTGSIVEYGLLSSATAGTLISRDTETAIAKGANDTLTVQYQLTFS